MGKTAEGSKAIYREAQGVGINGWMRAAGMGKRPVKVAVPVELRVDVSAHVFWTRGITTRFYIRIANINTGSYLHMTP